MTFITGLRDLFASTILSCRQSKPCVVFDLDNTLIYSTELPTTGYVFEIIVKNKKYYVHVRPGASEILQKLSSSFEIFFFTASSGEYADTIIKKIAPFVPKTHRFFKDSCLFKYGYALKDLQKIHRPLNTIILIDDILGSGSLHPLNTIAIEPWNGSFKDRVLLHELYPLLMSCSTELDIAQAVHEKLRETMPQHLTYFSL